MIWNSWHTEEAVQSETEELLICGCLPFEATVRLDSGEKVLRCLQTLVVHERNKGSSGDVSALPHDRRVVYDHHLVLDEHIVDLNNSPEGLDEYELFR